MHTLYTIKTLYISNKVLTVRKFGRTCLDFLKGLFIKALATASTYNKTNGQTGLHTQFSSKLFFFLLESGTYGRCARLQNFSLDCFSAVSGMRFDTISKASVVSGISSQTV